MTLRNDVSPVAKVLKYAVQYWLHSPWVYITLILIGLHANRMWSGGQRALSMKPHRCIASSQKAMKPVHNVTGLANTQESAIAPLPSTTHLATQLAKYFSTGNLL